MNRQTIQAANFGKKSYEKPEVKVYPVNAASIICESVTSSQNEEYVEEKPYGWF